MIDETVNKPIHIKFPVLNEVAMAMLQTEMKMKKCHSKLSIFIWSSGRLDKQNLINHFGCVRREYMGKRKWVNREGCLQIRRESFSSKHFKVKSWLMENRNKQLSILLKLQRPFPPLGDYRANQSCTALPTSQFQCNSSWFYKHNKHWNSNII